MIYTLNEEKTKLELGRIQAREVMKEEVKIQAQGVSVKVDLGGDLVAGF